MIDVSVIITTKNEEQHIENCLKSVKEQDYPAENIEIIVVDNKSTDRTKEIARKYTEKVFDHGPERSAQRNYGVNQAQGKWMLYLDADMMLSGRVIAECVQKAEKENLIALYIPEKIVGKGFWIRVRNFERSFYNATVIDCVRFVRRDVFLAIGGFDELLTGPEDWDFDRRIREKGPVGIIDSALNHNEGEFNLKRYVMKKTYYAQSFRHYVDKWGRHDPEIRKQLGIGYRYLGVFVERGKGRKLVVHLGLTLSMYMLRVGVGFYYFLGRTKKMVADGL